MASDYRFEPLPADQVAAAINRASPARVPQVRTKWWGQGLNEQYGDQLRRFDRYPEDALFCGDNAFDYDAWGLSWYGGKQASHAHDAGGVLPDWKNLDEFIEKMPDPDKPGFLSDKTKDIAEKAHRENRYLLFSSWRLFFERPWQLRGMQNLMLDYFDHPDEVHKLHQALSDLYRGMIRRAARDLDADGFWTSDDLGNQQQLMMMPDQFRSFIKPYYRQVSGCLREQNMHFWLHSCGNNTDIMEDLIEAGVDVFHPVQKGTMDLHETATRFGNRMCFLVGFDVQHLLPEGTPDQVRREVRFLIDTFDRPGGGMGMAAGNGIVAGIPLDNIEAFLDETLRYGTEHRQGARYP